MKVNSSKIDTGALTITIQMARAIDEDWRLQKNWQPGWEYIIKG